MRRKKIAVFAALTGALATVLSGCGTPGAPQAPSLNLPAPVRDLSAQRYGERVTLNWTMPRRSTDKLLLHGNLRVRVCRAVEQEDCAQAGGDLQLTPGSVGAFTETLPAALSTGPARALHYRVELMNSGNHSAGLSNAATVVAGAAPEALQDVRLEVRKSGVVVHWKAVPGSEDAVRLHRKLVSPAKKKTESGLLAAQPEATEASFLVAEGASHGLALDATTRFGESYEYRVEPVRSLEANGLRLELSGQQSEALRVDVADHFPPETPRALVGVAVSAMADGDEAVAKSGRSIDLSWQPVADTDLAGYVIYRREPGGDWQWISPQGAVVAPAYRDMTAEPGHRYEYAVTAIDQSGHESRRSATASEEIPVEAGR